jgi:hypothetical protein
MNERIKELMQQAGTDSSGKWMGVEHAKKFAEMIVKECSNFLKDTLDDHFAAEQLEEHFGVKE